jgi:hypothetical protein
MRAEYSIALRSGVPNSGNGLFNVLASEQTLRNFDCPVAQLQIQAVSESPPMSR